jgi:hypothetical protein
VQKADQRQYADAGNQQPLAFGVEPAAKCHAAKAGAQSAWYRRESFDKVVLNA